MKLKKLISLAVCILLLVSSTIPAFATENNGNNTDFKDVKQGYWAYDQIMWMLQKGIINGTGGGYFSPDGLVTRSQFAKMMVLTLNLKLYYPDSPSFLDVSKNAWEYPYVEGAKTYLTGFRTSQGDYFKPSLSAVREDMAVALVKAMGYQNETADESILGRFADAGQISPNLRKYIALSVKHGLVEGYTQNGQTIFNPQGNLTRAQASTLLYKAFKSNEDKVTYDDNKVTYNNEDTVTANGKTYIKPRISVSNDNNKVVISWNKIPSATGYAVIISKNDSTPTINENGYLYLYTTNSQTSATVNNSTAYTGNSDFGKYLEKNQKYYFSVTAIYSDATIPGNTIQKKYTGPNSPDSYTAPSVSMVVENGKLVMKWNKITSSSFKEYKVVISKNDNTPVYPDNGYLYNITNRDQTSAVIDNRSAYSGNSDFGKYLTKGQAYYFSVTAVYDDRKVTGNTIQYVYPGNGDEYLYPAPVVYTTTENGNLVVRWSRITSDKLEGYKVVVSRNDSTPSYPDNGYLYNITDRNTTYAVINNSSKYNNGDFGEYLTVGEKYYFSVTAVYKDRKVAGNAVQCQYSGTQNPQTYVTPALSASEENGRTVLRWNRIDSPILHGYKVVVSKGDNSPSYPDNGYLYYITDRNRNYAVLDSTTAYTGGDFGGYLIKGETYYFSITAVYNDRNVTSNVVRYAYKGDDNPALFPTPVVSTAYEGGNLVVKWNRIDSAQLVEFRVVASNHDTSPEYPYDGYYDTAFPKSTTSVAIMFNTKTYKNGDFTAMSDAREYYITVTAVYNNNKYRTGNVVKILYVLPPKQ